MIPLRAALDRARYGGKAAQLAQALAAGLPVPEGWALPADETALPVPTLPGNWAVRSSAVDEDGATASFAGQHATLLHVPGDRLTEAVAVVTASGADSAAYRARLGLAPSAAIPVVIQEMVAATCAGVLFTRSPLTGAAELWIEASWGLGEAVVQGLVTPDQWRLAPDGTLLAFRPGEKDREIVAGEGGTVERPITGDRVSAPCLDAAALAALVALVETLDRTFPGAHDVEFAFDHAGRLFLLQRREITR